MECSEVKELLILYVTGEIEGNLKKDVENHLKKCSLCKREFEILSLFINNIEKEKRTIPPELDFKMVEAIERQKEKSLFSLITRFLYPLIFALGLMIGVFLGMGLNKNKEDKTLSLIKENTFYIEPYIQNISPEEVLNERTK